LILFLGINAWTAIPKDILPVFKAPAVQVLTYYAGMPADYVEKTITNRIERWVTQAPGVEKIESKSVPGVSVVKVYFRDDIDPSSALTLTTSLAQGTLPTLPPNTLPPVTLPFDPTGTLPLGVLTVQNPKLREADLKDRARIDVRNMLGSVPGCVAPVVIGGQDRTVLVYLDPEKLQVRGLSPLDVVNALKAGNRMVSPGTAYFGNNQILLDTNLMVEKPQDLDKIPIPTKSGAVVLLGDVGHADDTATIQTSRVRITDAKRPRGGREVYVPIYRQQGASSLNVANGVKAKLREIEDRLRQLHPEDGETKLHFVMDQSLYIDESIHSLIHELFIGAALVALMILTFLGNPRMTMIAVMSIPLAVLTSVVCLLATGNTINAMTLGGLALAVGPLVDDAIVVLENTHRHHALGKSRWKAAFDGAVEVTTPVLVATATTIIVLCPIALMPGMGGFLFKPLTLAVAFAMIASFVLSRTFVPMLCARWMGGHAAHPGAGHGGDGWFARLHRPIDRGLTFLTRRYERLLLAALRWRFLVLGAVALLFVGSLCLAFGIGREFFPQVDAGMIAVHVRAPSKSRLDRTEQRVIDVERFLEQQIPADEREMIVSEIGLDPDWSAGYSENSGQQDAVVRVQLKENRAYCAQEYAVRLRHALAADRSGKFTDLRFSFDTGGMVSSALNYGASSPIDVEVTGGTPRDAMALARDIRNAIAFGKEPVRGAVDVRVEQRRDAPYMVFKVNRQKAQSVGLTAEDVIEQVVAAMNSSISIDRNFWIDEKTQNQYFVAVQYREDPNRKLEDVMNIAATGTHHTGNPVTLGQLCQTDYRWGAVEVKHLDLYRTLDVLVNTENRDIGGVAGDIRARLKDLQDRKWEQATRAHADGTRLAAAAPAAAGLVKPAPDTEPRVTDKGALRFPGGLKVELKGEYKSMNESFANLSRGLIFAAFLVYCLMVPLFRSYLGPLIIMVTVPLGLIGVLTMLFVTRTTLNVQSEMGVIFLVGIVVSNGVLLIDFANKQRKAGASVHKAITTAAVIRFRPIMMTFLATFLDLIPMAIGMGRGSEANVPLARAVVGGLLTSTCLTLLVVPILFTLLIKDRKEEEVDLDAELAEHPVPRPALVAAFAGHGGNGDVSVASVHAGDGPDGAAPQHGEGA
jgi:multidrug efflux pump subunit AcrB